MQTHKLEVLNPFPVQTKTNYHNL